MYLGSFGGLEHLRVKKAENINDQPHQSVNGISEVLQARLLTVNPQ
jgi:hypothetical protein